MPEYTPQQLDEIRLQAQIARLVDKDRFSLRRKRPQAAEPRKLSCYRPPGPDRAKPHFPRQPKIAAPVVRGSPERYETAPPGPEGRSASAGAVEAGIDPQTPPECNVCLKRPPYCRCAPMNYIQQYDGDLVKPNPHRRTPRMKKSAIFTKLEPDPAGQILQTRFLRFESSFGISGLCRENSAGMIEILAIASNSPQRGQCRRFFRALKRNFKTICVWHVENPILAAALARYGFRPEETVDEHGDRLTGFRWDQADLPLTPAPQQ